MSNENGENITTTHSYKKQFFEYALLPENAIFWDNKKFKCICMGIGSGENCGAHPCLLVYEKMAVSDPGKHCTHLMGLDDVNNEEENGDTGDTSLEDTGL